MARAVGVYVLGASEDHVQRMRSPRNSSFGFIIGDSSRSRADHIFSVDDGVSGVLIHHSTEMRLDHNTVRGNRIGPLREIRWGGSNPRPGS